MRPSFHASSRSASSTQRSPRGRRSSRTLRGRPHRELARRSPASRACADERRPPRSRARVASARAETHPKWRYGESREVASSRDRIVPCPVRTARPSRSHGGCATPRRPPRRPRDVCADAQARGLPRLAGALRAGGSPAASRGARRARRAATPGDTARTPGSGRARRTRDLAGAGRRSSRRRAGGRTLRARRALALARVGAARRRSRRRPPRRPVAPRFTVSATTSPRRRRARPPTRRRDTSRSASDSCEEARRLAAAPYRVLVDPVVEDEEREHCLGRVERWRGASGCRGGGGRV